MWNVTKALNRETRAGILRQLKDIEQQIDHLLQSFEPDDACLDIVRQCHTMQQALNAVSLTLLASCLETSAAQASACPDVDCRSEQVARMNELYAALRRLTAPPTRRT